MNAASRARGSILTPICGVVMVALLPSRSFSSSAVAIVTSQGIVVGVDEKSVDRCDGPCGPQAESRKAVLVQGRVAVSMAGVHTVLGNPHQVAPYSFPSFIGQVEARLTRRTTVSEVSEAVKEEAGKVFFWFDSYLRHRLFGQKDFPGDYPVEYLIAGYEAGDPRIYAVRVEVDWQQLRLKDVQRTLVHPRPDDRAPHGIYGAGSTRVLDELTNQQGALFRRVMATAPLEGHALLDTKALSLEQAGDLALTLLEIEASANPEQVGRPFTIAIIPKNGPPLLDVTRKGSGDRSRNR